MCDLIIITCSMLIVSIGYITRLGGKYFSTVLFALNQLQFENCIRTVLEKKCDPAPDAVNEIFTVIKVICEDFQTF